MRVIIDTNILVSAAVADGKPETAINFIISSSNYEWIVSEEILAEYREVLNRLQEFRI
ncbi:MAG: PIN domain-containing protein [Okeania sp. SIO3B5]|uniref:PIN domain-containing protein n=1 Tax=Okeania sp. SIO3B5 TaxID=2607811 RepID=UPI0013FF7867|nr:PIN domain-containing protein [Okeania sp. SIO3B5]NEO52089.1 PIN domain-containing protein [Okeania sp. SIO3B5]